MTAAGFGIDDSTAGWFARERARPERIRAWPGAWILAVATVCFGAFMGQLDASVVTLTYRPLEAEFHAGLAGVEWVSLAYLLTLIALLIPVGRLSDAHGRKLLYLYGLVVFTAASAACGLAPSLGVLVGCRVVQAAGAAMLQANSVALVTTSAPAVRRRDALGAQAGAQALGLALGPTAGGILVSTVGWRWVFFINVPVGLVALVAGYYLLPRTRQRSPMATVDLVSVGLLAVASTGLLLGMSAASGLSIPGLGILGSLLLAALAGWAFRDRQRRLVGRPETRRRRPAGHNRWSHYLFAHRVASVQFAGAPRADPLINPGLCRDPVVSWGLVGALCGYFILFGPLVLVPMALEGRGVSVLASGLTLTALPAGFALAAVVGAAGLPHALDERRALLAVAASWMGPRPG